MADQRDDEDEMAQALEAGVPDIYFNGFANYLSSSDILMVLQRNGQPVAMLNVALPIAKAFSESLVALVASHERAAGYTLDPHLERARDDTGSEN